MPKAREGREHERGELFSLSLRGFGVSPPRFFLNFERFDVRFNVFFMRLGTDFRHDYLLEKI